MGAEDVRGLIARASLIVLTALTLSGASGCVAARAPKGIQCRVWEHRPPGPLEVTDPPRLDVPKGLHRIGLIMLNGGGDVPTRLEIQGQTVVNRILPSDWDGTGISLGLECGLSGPTRIVVTRGAQRAEKVVILDSDRTVVLVESGRLLSIDAMDRDKVELD